MYFFCIYIGENKLNLFVYLGTYHEILNHLNTKKICLDTKLKNNKQSPKAIGLLHFSRYPIRSLIAFSITQCCYTCQKVIYHQGTSPILSLIILGYSNCAVFILDINFKVKRVFVDI